MNGRKIVTMFIAVVALCAFALVSTTPVTAASKKKADQETVKKSTKKAKKATAETTKALPTGKININTADKETLMTFPGIGPTKADEIIKVRKEGKFKNLDDVMGVTGIGEETLKKMKPFLKFE